MIRFRRDAAFGKRYLLGNLIYFLPGAVAFFFAIKHISEFNLIFAISTSAFAAWVAVGVGIEIYRFKTYVCPRCGSRIRKQLIKEDDRIFYYCCRCDIEWDTTLRVPDISG
jgi:hypothetical protein